MQRSNFVSLDAMQKIVNSFKQVERKLDRLQEDFTAQSKTINDLRIMVGILSLQSREEEEMRTKIGKRDMSHASLKRKAPRNSYKVIKAKSFEPVNTKSPLITKRPLKIKKADGLKKGSHGVTVKTVNNMDSAIRDSKLTKHF